MEVLHAFTGGALSSTILDDCIFPEICHESRDSQHLNVETRFHLVEESFKKPSPSRTSFERDENTS